MTFLLWTLLVASVFEIVGRAHWLATGSWPERTGAHIAVGLVLNAGLLVWVAVLLAK